MTAREMKVVEKVVLPILERALEPDSGRYLLVCAAVRELRELLGIEAPMPRDQMERLARRCVDLERWVRKGARRCALESDWDALLISEVHGGVEPGLPADMWTGADWMNRKRQLEGYRRFYHGYLSAIEKADSDLVEGTTS